MVVKFFFLVWVVMFLCVYVRVVLVFLVLFYYFGEVQRLVDFIYGLILGQLDFYNYYWGIDRFFLGNILDLIFLIQKGFFGVDDWVWQNFLLVEWLIFEFYQ